MKEFASLEDAIKEAVCCDFGEVRIRHSCEVKQANQANSPHKYFCHDSRECFYMECNTNLRYCTFYLVEEKFTAKK